MSNNAEGRGRQTDHCGTQGLRCPGLPCLGISFFADSVFPLSGCLFSQAIAINIYGPEWQFLTWLATSFLVPVEESRDRL